MALGEDVEAHDAARGEIEPAADALAGAAAGTRRTAVGVVMGDGAAGDGQGADTEVCGAVIVDPAAQAIAAVALRPARAARDS
jgi:hypothetical protein